MNPELDDGDVDGMRGAEALLAGLLGLMTAHTETRFDADRRRLAHKIAADLARLSDEPGVSKHFRLVLCTMKAHWRQLQDEYTDVPPQPDSIYARSGSTAVH